MENDLINKENWIQKNWIWVLLLLISTTFFLFFLFNANSKNGLADTVSAFSENALFEKAIEHANNDDKIITTIGKIDPVEQIAILEGNTTFSNNENTVSLSVRINGVKRNGKLQVIANRKGKDWDYQKISVLTKNPKEEIVVLNKL